MLLEITFYFSMIFVLDEEDLEDRLQGLDLGKHLFSLPQTRNKFI
jgi:hypothetical protein